MHIGLAGMKLEQPSTNFTNNLLENLGIVVVKKRSWTTKPAYIFAGIMFVMVVISAIFLGNSTAVANPISTKILSISRQFFNATFVRILLIINVLLLLFVIDRKIFRPFFEKRKMSF